MKTIACGALLGVVVLLAGCGDSVGSGGSGGGQVGTPATSAMDLCGGTFQCMYFPSDDEPIGPMSSGSYGHEDVCLLYDLETPDGDLTAFVTGGYAQMFGVDGGWTRTGSSVSLAVDIGKERVSLVCTTDGSAPERPAASTSPSAPSGAATTARCHGTPLACRSRSASSGLCTGGCTPYFQTANGWSQSVCTGSPTRCESLDSYGCKDAPGCTWDLRRRGPRARAPDAFFAYVTCQKEAGV